MDLSDWFAGLALATSGAALGLELRRWFESKPRLRLSVMADAVITPGDDGKPKLVVTATNIGQYPTMITHLVVFGYETERKRKRNDPEFRAFVPDPGRNLGLTLPEELQPFKQWMGIAYYDRNISAYREAGLLYVGVSVSHRDEPYLIKVSPKPPKEIEALSGGVPPLN